MISDKKYITRTDLKVVGFGDLRFFKNRSLNKIFLEAKLNYTFKDSKYLINFLVETDDERTSQRAIEKLCRLMILRYEAFINMKINEQKKFIEEYGEKANV